MWIDVTASKYGTEMNQLYRTLKRFHHFCPTKKKAVKAAKTMARAVCVRKSFRSGPAEGGKGGEGGAPDRPVTANTPFATFTPFGSDCWKKWRSVRYREKGPPVLPSRARPATEADPSLA